MRPDRPPGRPWRQRRTGVLLGLAITAAVAGFGSASASAAEATETDLLASHPGFFDLDALGLFERAELNVHISVKGPLLDLVASAARESDPELAAALGALAGIEVRVYEVGEAKRSRIKNLLARSADRLRDGGWRTAITIQVDRDHGYALLRFADKGSAAADPVGLVAMYLTEGNQAVFVNIVGDLDTESIGRLARRFDLDLLAIEEPPG